MVKGTAEHYGTQLLVYLKRNRELFDAYDQGNESIEPQDGDDYNLGIY
ncbi:hypothetical protein [Sanyastnella coralliicola]|nr:hypothetical protein [Longitalea sp. SCSIO 12813]